ncbi:NAD-dependent epimerase/dehydratase family protein [Haloarcula halophila]|uniref:NAD-dependent epimerase/dehydratase family protein n=1 Tax=Haloarcula TaxID=2237 RepID=UPI0023E46AB2|nr:NAD-dependent epimerase/dehydratase family protein [Halomicroarcula sp. DFY41]
MTVEVSSLIVDISSSLRETMQAIDQTGLGIAFVTENSELVGVVTDGDIRTGILRGMSIDDPVEQVVNDDPILLRNSWEDQQRRRKLRRRDIESKVRHHGSLVVPVIDDQRRVVDFEFISADTEILSRPQSYTGSVSTVLVIGGAGYIGSVLSRCLLEDGYRVRVLDKAVYGTAGISDLRTNDRFTFIKGDMRSIETVSEAITGVDAVVHLGALVGDPASEIDPQKTLEMNYHSTRMIANICKYHQINRFIFASTCSVYGKSHDATKLLTEEDSLNPVSLYAKTKIESEQALLDMADGNFSPTVFRMATIYGLSPRMRFDLVVNILSAKAHFENTIPIFGGDQYRPNVHVRDAARAYIAAIEAPIDDVGGEIFNVGSNAQNYRIAEVGRQIADVFPDAEIDFHRDKEDDRSYQVDFSKIHETLGYEVEETIQSGCWEIRDTLEVGEFADYTTERYSNYKTLEDAPILDI